MIRGGLEYGPCPNVRSGAPGVNDAAPLTRVRLSVIVPTLNEEAVIAETLRRAIASLAPHEIIVADGCSSDGTVQRARPYANVLEMTLSRGAALNYAATIATGDVLIFLHADTVLPIGAAHAIAGALEHPDVIGGAFRLRLDHPGRFAALVSWSVNFRSRLLNSFFGDQAMFVRSEIFARSGGFKDWSVMEDLEILARLRPCGRLALLDEVVVTSARRHEKAGWLVTLATIWSLTLLNRLGVPGRVLRRWYKPRR